MKFKYLIATFWLAIGSAQGQSTFIYDQQSINLIEGTASLQPSAQPTGQSFTPTFSTVGFVMLYLYNNLAGTAYINLRSGSITGTILSSTTPVFMPDGFYGITNFNFPVPVAITPGVTYFLQPVLLSGSGSFVSLVTDTSYAGTAYSQGVPIRSAELWFREGIVVPEPSAAWLALLVGGVLAWRCRKR
jgi:hypothetical protein